MEDTLRTSFKKWNVLKGVKDNQLEDILYFHGFKVDKSDNIDGKVGALFLTSGDEMYAVGYNNAENLLALIDNRAGKSTEITEPRKIEKLSGLNITKFAVTERFGAALTNEGKLLYWGREMRSIQFEERSLKYVSLPHEPRKDFRAVDMACGARFVTFITNKGEVVLWGTVKPLYSELYDFKRILTRRNVQVKSVSCGWYHVVLRDQNGNVWTFGHGSVGQLGYNWSEPDNGYTSPRKVPLHGACVKVECGAYSTLFLLENNEIYACGSNTQSDHLCVGRTGYVAKPAKVILDSPITDIAAAYAWVGGWQSLFAAYSESEKKYFKWGDNTKRDTPAVVNGSQHFLDIFANITTPQSVGNLSSSVDLFGEGEITNSVHTSETRRFFERWDVFDYATDDFLPKIDRFTVATAIPLNFSNGLAYFAYVVTKDDDVYSWTNAEAKLLGQPNKTMLTYAPAKMENLSNKNIKKILVNLKLGLALSADGSLYSWQNFETPTLLEGLNKVKDIATGITSVIYLMEDNTVWEENYQIQIPVSDQIVALEAGIRHCAVLTSKAEVFTFGEGRYGQLGYKLNQSDSPKVSRKVELPGACIKIACGASTTYFLLANGELYACGINVTNDFLPVGHQKVVVTPEKVIVDGPIVDVAANKKLGHNFTLGTLAAVLTAKGEVYKWGGVFEKPTLDEGASMLVEAFGDSDLPQSMSLLPVPTSNEVEDDYETDSDVEDMFREKRELAINLFDDRLYSDLKIKLADSTIAAHRFILHTKSAFFKRELMSAELSNHNQLDLSSYNPNAIIAVLKHIYRLPIGRIAYELKDLLEFHNIAKRDGDVELIKKSEKLLAGNLLRIVVTWRLSSYSTDDQDKILGRLYPDEPFP